MATDPRAALDRLFAAFTAHLDAAATAQAADAPSVLDAADTLMDAFDTYDEALYDTYEVDTPFVVYDGDDDDEDWDDDVDDVDDVEDLEPGAGGPDRAHLRSEERRVGKECSSRRVDARAVWQ